MRLLVLACAAVLAAPALAQAADPPSFQVGTPPAICSSSFYTDQVLTDGPDVASAGFAATRLWGLAGDDQLAGSPTRATCVLGGRGNDLLALRGGAGIDGYGGLDGDDDLDTRDGEAELVDCGAGDDTVRGDRVDVVTGCETVRLAGPAPARLRATPARIGYRGVPRIRFRVPQGGGPRSYRVLLTTGKPEDATPGCTAGPVDVARFPATGERLRRGQRVSVGLRPPEGGYCRGTQRAVVVRSTRPGGPGEPIARLSFRVTG